MTDDPLLKIPDDLQELVGRKLFCHRVDTFYEIKKINDPIEDIEENGPTMTVHDLFFDQQLNAVFVADIGEDFWLVPDGFPQEKIDRVHAFVRHRDDASSIIEEISLMYDEIPY